MRYTIIGLLALLVSLPGLAQPTRNTIPQPVPPVNLIQGAVATTSTTQDVLVNGAPKRVVARATSGTYNATVTVYGTDTPCRSACTSSDGTSLGTITTDGGTLDVNTGTRYLYVFALVTSYTSGTIRADVSPLQDYFGGTLGDAGSVNVANIMHYGGNGDGSTDNLAAATAALATLSDEGTLYFPKHATGASAGYYFSDTLTVDHRINVFFEPGVRLKWDVAELGDNPAFVWDGSAADNANYQPQFVGGPVLEISNTSTSNTENFVFDAQGVRHAFVEIGAIYGGYGGVRLHATSGRYNAFNRYRIGRMFGQSVAIQAYADGTGSVNAWINGNHVEVGEINMSSTGATQAVQFRRVNSPTDDNLNHNVFDIEVIEGGGGGTNTVAQFYAGNENIIRVQHLEGFETILDVVATEGSTTHNVVELNDLVRSDTESSITIVDDPATGAGNGLDDDWHGNVVVTRLAEPKVTSWSIPDMARAVYETDGSGTISIPGMSFQGFNFEDWAWESRDDEAHEIVIPNGNIAEAFYRYNFRIVPLVMIDTTVHKTFTFQWFSGDRSNIANGRFILFAQNTNGDFYDPGTNSDDIDRVSFQDDALQSSGWDGWGQSSDEGDQTITVSVDDTITAVLVGVAGGSDQIELKSIAVSVPYNSVHQESLRIIDPFGTGSGGIKRATLAPATIGYYGLGEVLVDTDGTQFFVATTAGWMAPAWAMSTSYEAGTIALDDINNIYAALATGTSGTGGLTGTSSTGTHDGSNNAAIMTDSGESFTTDVWIGLTINNTTDGSSCTITDNDGTTITCTLAGGTDDDWDTGDTWTIDALDDGGIAWRYVDEVAAFTAL